MMSQLLIHCEPLCLKQSSERGFKDTAKFGELAVIVSWYEHNKQVVRDFSVRPCQMLKDITDKTVSMFDHGTDVDLLREYNTIGWVCIWCMLRQ